MLGGLILFLDHLDHPQNQNQFFKMQETKGRFLLLSLLIHQHAYVINYTQKTAAKRNIKEPNLLFLMFVRFCRLRSVIHTIRTHKARAEYIRRVAEKVRLCVHNLSYMCFSLLFAFLSKTAKRNRSSSPPSRCCCLS
jgi:hypothetical protein